MKWIMVGLVCAAILLIFLFVNKCPNCGRPFAMRETGSRQRGGVSGFGFVETRCRYCGHVKWMETSFPP